ncbi:M28 family peptidase [Balneolaceae bacterium ANBcel3]|nr:M28 family peptidase [Balneolaceae bacterium ANBcel3]
MNDLVHLVKNLASVPSFSSWEEVIHPMIKEHLKPIEHIQWHHVPDNNLIAVIPGNADKKPVALSAHLDKINHFGEHPPSTLPVQITPEKAIGQMDDAVGLAICIAMALQSQSDDFPPLLLLFSEMEESYGLKHHPHLLKNEGKGYSHGLGAKRISEYLLEHDMVPKCVITIDTTPLFKGQPGVALYSSHWEFTNAVVTEEEKEHTLKMCDELLSIDPGIRMANNHNDYLQYGLHLNKNGGNPVPSLAIEPAIHPYHQKNESVYIEDVERVFEIIQQWLREST